MIRIGCSGWNYRHWRGLFYPEGLPVKRWFEHYAAHFDAVEVNATFYRLPEAGTFAKWRDQAPPGFRYAVKAPRFITHMKKLKDCEHPTAEFLARVRHLGETLGLVLYQLPPSLRFDRDRLRAFSALLPPDLAHAIEPRDPSWLTDEPLSLLHEAGIGVCAHDMPGRGDNASATGKLAYVRFHGASGKYIGRYAEDMLSRWAGWLRAEEAKGRTAWAFFNNDIHGHAVEDARVLRELIGV
jgi:uncharacterized protein YecE (DUF72 family)